jgi:PAS domain S-box-containing protein
MPDAPLDPVRADAESLRARVSELEAELTALQQPPAFAQSGHLPPHPERHPQGEDRFHNLLDSVGVGFTLVDRGGQVLYESPAAQRLLGCKPDAAPGRNVFASLHPDDRDEAARFFGRVLDRAGERLGPVLLRGIHPAGGVVWVEAVLCNRLDDPDVGAVVACWSDVTARKREEEERQRLEARMYQTQHLESLGVLAGGIAHEFNNLLTTLIGYSDLARAEVPAQSPAQGYLTEVLTASRRAAELTQQVLAYAGKGRFFLQPVSLSELVQQMKPLLDTIVSPKAALELDLTLRGPIIEGDVSQLRQIIVNLVSNASEALGEQEGTITLRTSARDLDSPAQFSSHLVAFQANPGRYAVLEVSDTGCGMDEATRARIFEPFFTTRFTGRGLGLAAVLGIVRGHGGVVHVDSTLGEGARFQVLLPALPESWHGTSHAAPAPSESRKTVLVVEDEPAVRSLAVLVLTQAGYTVDQAGDGQAGLELFQQRPDDFDIVLLDLTMPRLDGLEVLARLQQLRPAVRVVLMTGYSTSDVAHWPGAPAPDGLLQKPFTGEGLLEAVRAVAGRNP